MVSCPNRLTFDQVEISYPEAADLPQDDALRGEMGSQCSETPFQPTDSCLKT